MSTHVSEFWVNFQFVLQHFVLTKVVTSSIIRVKSLFEAHKITMRNGTAVTCIVMDLLPCKGRTLLAFLIRCAIRAGTHGILPILVGATIPDFSFEDMSYN